MTFHYLWFIFVCTYLFLVRVSPFLVPLYPRPCVPSTTIQSLTGILQCTCLFSILMLPFLVTLYPRLCVPSTKIQLPAGILQCTSLFSVGMLPFLVLHYPRPRVPSTGIQPLAGMLQCTLSLPQFSITFSGSPLSLRFCIVIHQSFLLSTLFNSRPTDYPYQRRLSPNYEVWVGL